MAKKIIDSDTDEIQFIIKPSQLVNIGWVLLFLGGIILSFKFQNPWLCVGSGVLWFAKWLIIKCWSFDFHEKTIAERKGVFSILTREIHFFRIKSVRFEQPFFLRIFGLSNVILVTSDPLIPILRLYAVQGGENIKEYIKEQVSIWRRERTVKEQDIHPLM